MWGKRARASSINESGHFSTFGWYVMEGYHGIYSVL